MFHDCYELVDENGEVVVKTGTTLAGAIEMRDVIFKQPALRIFVATYVEGVDGVTNYAEPVCRGEVTQ